MSSTFDLTFRTDDLTRWGDGIGRNLHAVEVDLNFWILLELFLSLEENPVQPAEITSITQDGNQLTITLSNGDSFGPFTLPTSTFTWRGTWQPATEYHAYDLFNVQTGLFLVLQDHTSADDFDSGASNGAGLLYKHMIHYPTNLDVGFYFPGLPGTGISPLNPMFAYVFAHTAYADVITFAGSQAAIDVAFTNATTFNIVKTSEGVDINMGTLVFGPGNVDDWSFNLDDNFQFNPGDRIKIIRPTSIDDTGFNLSVTMTLTRGDIEGPSSS